MIRHLLLSAFWCLCYVIGDKEFVHHGGGHHHSHDGVHNSHFDHEAILGSENADIFDNLSPEEAKKRLSVFVDKMDTNADGQLSREEVAAWISNSFKLSEQEEIVADFDENDANKDEFVSWEEILSGELGLADDEVANVMAGHYESLDDGLEFKQTFWRRKLFHHRNRTNRMTLVVSSKRKMVDEDKAKFEASDLNKDGKLDRKEFAAFEHPHNYKQTSHFESERVFKEIDRDSSQSVSLNEFLAREGIESKHATEKDWVEEETMRFKHLDKNKDDQLSVEELQPWASPSNEDAAMEETNHLFENTDKDRDNVLTKEEVLNEHELWVGSQVTEFGDQISSPPDHTEL